MNRFKSRPMRSSQIVTDNPAAWFMSEDLHIWMCVCVCVCVCVCMYIYVYVYRPTVNQLFCFPCRFSALDSLLQEQFQSFNFWVHYQAYISSCTSKLCNYTFVAWQICGFNAIHMKLFQNCLLTVGTTYMSGNFMAFHIKLASYFPITTPLTQEKFITHERFVVKSNSGKVSTVYPTPPPMVNQSANTPPPPTQTDRKVWKVLADRCFASIYQHTSKQSLLSACIPTPTSHKLKQQGGNLLGNSYSFHLNLTTPALLFSLAFVCCWRKCRQLGTSITMTPPPHITSAIHHSSVAVCPKLFTNFSLLLESCISGHRVNSSGREGTLSCLTLKGGGD